VHFAAALAGHFVAQFVPEVTVCHFISPERYSEIPPLLIQGYAIAFDITRNHADAADAVAIAIVRVFKCPTNPTCLRAFFLQAVRREALQILRRRERHTTHSRLSAKTDEEPAPNHATDDVRGAVNQLQPLYREAIDLCYFQKCSREEAAQQLDITIAALDSRLHKGRLMLKSPLREYRHIGLKREKKKQSLRPPATPA
jgi:RNA polymerase sigma factor (sigma-70 family)